jgi:hypothetical protein
LNPTHEIKRAIRHALSNTHLSRDQIVDLMNTAASKDGLCKTVSKSVLDSWTKESGADRLPSLPWLTIFCAVVGDPSPIAALLRPLGFGVIDDRGCVLLEWAEAEIEKKKATRRAKYALAAIEDMKGQ